MLHIFTITSKGHLMLTGLPAYQSDYTGVFRYTHNKEQFRVFGNGQSHHVMKYSMHDMSLVMHSVGFHSDLISSNDYFMRHDCPLRLASAQFFCSCHGSMELGELQPMSAIFKLLASHGFFPIHRNYFLC